MGICTSKSKQDSVVACTHTKAVKKANEEETLPLQEQPPKNISSIGPQKAVDSVTATNHDQQPPTNKDVTLPIVLNSSSIYTDVTQTTEVSDVVPSMHTPQRAEVGIVDGSLSRSSSETCKRFGLAVGSYEYLLQCIEDERQAAHPQPYSKTKSIQIHTVIHEDYDDDDDDQVVDKNATFQELRQIFQK